MRKKKSDSRLMPYVIGMAAGCGAALLISAAAALVLSFSDAAARSAGAASAIALIVGSFVCGRTAGVIRRRDGMRTGVLCGLMFSAIHVVLALIFGQFGTVMLLVKPLLCVSFGTAGGVAGVNTGED